MKLLDEYEATCKVRRLAVRTIQTYRRWVEEFLRFHRDRSGRWIHPKDLGTPEVEAFLTHLAVNRRVAENTQNQALGAILFLYRNVVVKDLGPLDAIRAKGDRSSSLLSDLQRVWIEPWNKFLESLSDDFEPRQLEHRRPKAAPRGTSARGGGVVKYGDVRSV